jgi:hypothetical protein
MKKPTKKLLVIAGLAVVTATTGFAQSGVITVDENGNGTYVSGGTTTTLLFGNSVFESNSGLTTLAYFLPFSAQAGDVILREGGVDSDIYRFDGSNRLFVFSDVNTADGPDSPADVGLPAPFGSTVFFNEVGPEVGPNGYFGYNPVGPVIPGNNGGIATYNFISDVAPVPEPSTLALLACGLGIAGRRFWRR